MTTTRTNPYLLMFGQEPQQLITRKVETEQVIREFTSKSQSQQCYMICGLRGTGKTVFADTIKSELSKDPSWITLELNSSTDLLEDLASKLASNTTYTKWFHEAKINLSAFGFGVEIAHVAPVVNLETAVKEMLIALKKHNKRLLLIIDEVTNTASMRKFSTAFQIFLKENLPVYLLMTGLFENVKDLKDVDNLTFLYRCPSINLVPLNNREIAQNYEKTLGVSHEDALKMAALTKGYSFAFQALGHEAFDNGGLNDETLQQYQNDLFEYSYKKIWSELSNNDRKVLYGLAKTKNGKYADIMKVLDIDKNHLNPYRKRLLEKGIITSVERGKLAFTLPYFGAFTIETYEDDMYYETL